MLDSAWQFEFDDLVSSGGIGKNAGLRSPPFAAHSDDNSQGGNSALWN
jgi:hypothetical protein